MQHKRPEFVSTLHRHERLGKPLVSALLEIMLDSKAGWYERGTAAKVLALADARSTAASLLDLFFTQTDKAELWETALTIEHAGDQAAVPRLIDALYDTNSHRRHAAARALGWVWPVGRQAAKALIRALLDKSQPQPVREEAAESLAYSNYQLAIGPLISVFDEPDARIRFWSVFALGGIGQWQTYESRGVGQRLAWRCADLRVIEALERMLADEAVPPGNWWSIGKEALAMLGKIEPQYQAMLDHEIGRVLNDPTSSPEDLRWAEGYHRKQHAPPR